MKPTIIIAATVGLLVGCDARVSTVPPEKVIEKNTTIINPPAKEEKKVENNTTIINPAPNGTKIRTIMDGFYSGATLIPAGEPTVPSPTAERLGLKGGRPIAARPGIGFGAWIERRFSE